jgi:hypothetical protein
MTLYLDTSALVKLYVEEEGRETVQNALAQAQRAAIATIGYAECRAALARKLRENGLGVAEYRPLPHPPPGYGGGPGWGCGAVEAQGARHKRYTPALPGYT